MTSQTITTTLDVTIEDELIEDMLDAAGYGIAFWAERATIDKEKRVYVVTERDDLGEDRPRTFTVTYERVAEVLAASLKPGFIDDDYREYVTQALIIDKDAGALDSYVADVIVQIAAMGELVYG